MWTGSACPTPVEGVSGDWREVRTATFTFCVPPLWGPWDARSGHVWRGQDVEVRWGTGFGQQVTTTRERIELRPGETPDDAERRMIEESRRELRETEEEIGGRRVRLAFNHVNGLYYASARWREPAVYFNGTARTLRGAAQAMQVYRTVRFATPDSTTRGGSGRQP